MPKAAKWFRRLGRAEKSAVIGLVGVLAAALIMAAATIASAIIGSQPPQGASASGVLAEQPEGASLQDINDALSELSGLVMTLASEGDDGDRSTAIEEVDLAASLRDCVAGALVLRDRNADGHYDEGVFLGFSVAPSMAADAINTAYAVASLRAHTEAGRWAEGVKVDFYSEYIDEAVMERITVSAEAALKRAASSAIRAVALGDGQICVAVELLVWLDSAR